MTQDAQSALRRIMEQYSRITRFCLVCNYVTRIIEPLASRCSKFRFRMLDTGSTKDRLEYIAKAENVHFEDGVLDTLIKTSDGDMRRAITYLQSAARLHSSVAASSHEASPSPITPKSIVEIAGVVPHSVIVSLCDAIGLDPPPDSEQDERISNSLPRASFDAIHASVKNIARQGYSGSQLLIQLHDYLMEHPTLAATKKAKSALALGEADKALTDGGDEELQFLNLALKLKKALE